MENDTSEVMVNDLSLVKGQRRKAVLHWSAATLDAWKWRRRKHTIPADNNLYAKRLILCRIYVNAESGVETSLMRLVEEVAPELCSKATALRIIRKLVARGMVDIRDGVRGRRVVMNPSFNDTYLPVVESAIDALERHGFVFQFEPSSRLIVVK